MVSVTASLEAEVGKWKAAYEQAVRENEQLRSSGGMLLSTGGRDSLDAAEWRDRFESCLAEKQALLERVDMLTGGAGRTGRGRLTAPDGGEGQAPSKSVEKAYLALREEYKVRDYCNCGSLAHVIILRRNFGGRCWNWSRSGRNGGIGGGVTRRRVVELHVFQRRLREVVDRRPARDGVRVGMALRLPSCSMYAI